MNVNLIKKMSKPQQLPLKNEEQNLEISLQEREFIGKDSDEGFNKDKLMVGYHFLIFSLTTFIYLILLGMKLSYIDFTRFYWSYINLPLFLMLASLTISLIYYLKIHRLGSKIPKKSTLNLLIILFNFHIFAFSMLLTLTLDSIINIELSTIFLPLFNSLFIAAIALGILLPKLLDREIRIYKGLTLIVIYYVSCIVFIIFLYLKMTLSANWSFSTIINILMSGIIVHLLFLISDCNKLKYYFADLLFILSSITALLLISFNLENEDKLSWNFVFLSLYIGNLFMISISLLYLCEYCS